MAEAVAVIALVVGIAAAIVLFISTRWTEKRPEPLHAYELSPDDAAVLEMLAGSLWGPEATLTLPSGRVVTGEEVARWTALESPDEP